MRPEEQNDRLDEAIEFIRNETADSETVRQAGARVWARIGQEMEPQQVQTIQSCADFQALLPDYRAGSLSAARALLVRDHLHECIACRREFMRRPHTRESAPSGRASRWNWFQVPRWAVAAALFIVAGFGSWEAWNRFGPPPEGPAATVAELDGELYRVVDGETVALRTGDAISRGETVRAAKDTRAAVRLRDGSIVEVNERSGFSVAETRRDVTLQLERGVVIVEAAHRASGHLYVATRDCRVAVTGTVFAVNSGVKGSRVSVVEGEVHVAQAGRNTVLHPGQQYSSAPSMTSVPVAQEIAWSQNANKHIALLKEIAALSQEMERQVRMPDARYTSRLIDALPATTVVYAALPNLGEPIADAYRVFQERLSQSPGLQEWWGKQMDEGKGAHAQEVIDELRRFASYLGDEIVITAAMTRDGKIGEPALLAEVKQGGFGEFAKAELEKRGDMQVRIVASAAEIPAAGEGESNELIIYVNNGVAAVSPAPATLREVASGLEAGGGGFAGTPLHDQVSAAYREGASFLLSADLERLTAGEQEARVLGNLKNMVIGQTESDGVPETRAIVTFQGSRTGVASWLAAPAPIGALDYVTDQASIVSAFAIKQPALVIDDLLATLPEFGKEIADVESKLGLSVRDDLAAAFGGELVIALDGAALPTPAWKVVAEVYDPGRLQSALRRLVDAANQLAAAEGKEAGFQMTEHAVNGRPYYQVATPGWKLTEFHYTFVNGYWIAAPSRALIEKAIFVRDTGAGLTTSERFTSMLPRDGHNNFSAMVYHNIGDVAAPLAEVLSDDQKQAVEGLGALMKPTLVLAYASDDRILAATRSEALGFTPGNLFGLRMPMGLAGIAK